MRTMSIVNKVQRSSRQLMSPFAQQVVRLSMRARPKRQRQNGMRSLIVLPSLERKQRHSQADQALRQIINQSPQYLRRNLVSIKHRDMVLKSLKRI